MQRGSRLAPARPGFFESGAQIRLEIETNQDAVVKVSEYLTLWIFAPATHPEQSGITGHSYGQWSQTRSLLRIRVEGLEGLKNCRKYLHISGFLTVVE